MIKVDKLSKTYDKRSRTAHQALYDVSFTLPDTGFVCIVGPSGCGKTSLLNAMGGIDSFDGGTVSTDTLGSLRCGRAKTEAERSASFGYIFQNYYLLPEYSAAYNVYLGLHSLELSHAEKLARVMEALRAVDMERFARRAVGQMSGGQQQRVAIARAIARRPRVIFADEPTGNLDEANTMNICTLLRRISRDSLVIMVTHEERIARFFADRIITLDSGRLVSDSSDWQRGGLSAGDGRAYTAEYADSTLEGEGLSLRLLRAEGAEEVKLTLLAERDRVIIKLDDSRTVSCLRGDEAPEIVEGERPVLRLETLEQESVDMDWTAPDSRAAAGSGLRLPMLFREAKNLLRSGGLRRLGSWLFLALLTVLLCVSVGDYLMVSTIEPEDFIVTDSHILELRIERGSAVDANTLGLQQLIGQYTEYLDSSGLDFSFVPHVPVTATYSTSVFRQMDSEATDLGSYSYVPLERLDESSLILGRFPENPDEIVVDRWVLEKVMERDGIIQSGISDVSYFLGCQIDYFKKNYAPTIVGICDSGEPAVYLDRSALVSVGSQGNELVALSELQSMFPGKYDELSLAFDECIVVTNNAGVEYTRKVGSQYITGSRQSYNIVSTIEEDTYACIVISDEALEGQLRSMMGERFYLWCADKEAMKAFIAGGLPGHLADMLQIEVIDRHGQSMASYAAATRIKMDARGIVTLSVIVLSLAMLGLLQRSRVTERIGLAAVYRLLGIPGRKLAAIFAIESLLMYLMSTLPAAVLTWAAAAVMTALPSAEASILLPWYAAGTVSLGIFAFHLLVTLLPLGRLLRLPPARLAAKYDL